MKKHMVSAVLLLIMMLSLSAQAAEMRVITSASDSFGETAFEIFLFRPERLFLEAKTILKYTILLSTNYILNPHTKY